MKPYLNMVRAIPVAYPRITAKDGTQPKDRVLGHYYDGNITFTDDAAEDIVRRMGESGVMQEYFGTLKRLVGEIDDPVVELSVTDGDSGDGKIKVEIGQESDVPGLRKLLVLEVGEWVPSLDEGDFIWIHEQSTCLDLKDGSVLLNFQGVVTWERP